MYSYSAEGNAILLHSVPNFALVITDGESVNTLQHFAYVLDCISLLVKHHISTIGSRHLAIINIPHAECPTCFRADHYIVLHTSPSRWSQIAYQYAHELCHYSIPENVAENLRWFEESICETASLYFLRQIAYLWMDRKENLITSDGAPYAPSFIEYANDTATKFTAFDFRDPVAIRELESDCYDRKRNMHLANALLPIFIDHPETWEAVPYLCQVNEKTLIASLDAWILVSPPQAQPGLRRIRNLF